MEQLELCFKICVALSMAMARLHNWLVGYMLSLNGEILGYSLFDIEGFKA